DNREAGARSVRGLQQALRDAGLRCIVAEPQVAAAPLRNLLGDAALRVASVDILGHELAPGPGSYSRMMLGIGEAIAACAGATPRVRPHHSSPSTPRPTRPVPTTRCRR